MPNYQIAILHFDNEAGKQWSDYWASMLDRGNGKLSVRSGHTASPHEYLTDLIGKSIVVAVLLTDSMLAFLEHEGHQIRDLLCKKSGIAGILCYTEQSDFDEISYKITNLKCWNIFCASENLENKQIVCELMDLVQKKSERRETKIRKFVTVMPCEIRKPYESIALIFKKETTGNVEFSVGKDEKRIGAKRLNGYTYTAGITMKAPGISRLYVYNDNTLICHHPLTFIPFDIEAFHYPQFLCQILGIGSNDMEALDAELVKLHEKSIPKDDSLNTLFGSYTHDAPAQRSPYELPTLLHFAASNGLSLFTSVLLDAPGSLAAYQVENKDGRDPAELAEIAGHTELANYLRAFIETEAVVQECDDIYVVMNRQSTFGSYNRSDADEDTVPDLQNIPRETEDTRHRRHSEPASVKSRSMPKPMKMPSAEEFMFGNTKEMSKTDTLSGSRTQDELIELGQAVKDKEFTIEEAERLYESWKARNQNSSCSIRDRQASLDTLRQEYGTVIEAVKAKHGERGVFKKLKKKLVKKLSSVDMKITKPLSVRPAMELPSTANRLSSSSNSSRDSCDSQAIGLQYGYGSESDELLDEEEEEEDSFDGQVIQTRQVTIRTAQSKRLSFREQYLKTFETSKLDEAPDLPPRNYRPPPLPPRSKSTC